MKRKVRKPLLPSTIVCKVTKSLPEKYKDKQKDYDYEEGWWENEFPVLRVWAKPDKDKVKVARTLVHEFIEGILEAGFLMRHKEAHLIAQLLEEEFVKYLKMFNAR